MNKENIYVLIDTQEKRLRALEILGNSQEEILHGSAIFKEADLVFKHLLYDISIKRWLMSMFDDGRNEISLDQLDKLLNPNYQVNEIILPLDELKSQANALGYELVEKKRVPKVGDFGVFWDDYEKGKIKYGFIKAFKRGFFKCDFGLSWQNFRHLTDEEKTSIQQSW